MFTHPFSIQNALESIFKQVMDKNLQPRIFPREWKPNLFA